MVINLAIARRLGARRARGVLLNADRVIEQRRF
jgi:hypothetical protein